MKFIKGLFIFLLIAGFSFMIITLTLASEHRKTFTEEIQSWSPAKDNSADSTNEKIEIENNKIIIK